MKVTGPIPPGTPCPNCGNIDRVLCEPQLNLKQWRCAECNRFLEGVSLPGKPKRTKEVDE